MKTIISAIFSPLTVTFTLSLTALFLVLLLCLKPKLLLGKKGYWLLGGRQINLARRAVRFSLGLAYFFTFFHLFLSVGLFIFNRYLRLCWPNIWGLRTPFEGLEEKINVFSTTLFGYNILLLPFTVINAFSSAVINSLIRIIFFEINSGEEKNEPIIKGKKPVIDLEEIENKKPIVLTWKEIYSSFFICMFYSFFSCLFFYAFIFWIAKMRISQNFDTLPVSFYRTDFTPRPSS